MIEQWKLVQGFEHQYAISNYGNIKNTKTNRLLKAIDQSILRVSLYDKNHKSYNRSIAHMVAVAFIANPHNYKYVIHIDGNHKNNHVTNLKWSEYPTNNVNSSRKPIPVHCLTNDKTYDSYKSCERDLGLSSGALYQYFKSDRKHIKGYSIKKII